MDSIGILISYSLKKSMMLCSILVSDHDLKYEVYQVCRMLV